MKKHTNLGTIEIADSTVIRMIRNLFITEKGLKVFPADKNGEIIYDGVKRFHSKDLSQNSEFISNADGIKYTFRAVVLFGVSIEKEVNTILKKIADELTDFFPDEKLEVKCIVLGVVSKKVSPRYLEYYLNYEP